MYIIAYDLSDEKERKSVIRVLEQFCDRVQFSVWCCTLSYDYIEKIQKRISSLNIQSGQIDIWCVTHSVYHAGIVKKQDNECNNFFI